MDATGRTRWAIAEGDIPGTCGLCWRSDQPVLMQPVRMDTRSANLAGIMATAWPG